MSTERETTANLRTITASEFKTKCLKLIDEVTETGEEIIITKNGKPVAKLTPHKPAAEEMRYQDRPMSPFGLNKGRYEIIGDLDDAFLDVDWDAETAKRWEDLP